MSRQPELWVDLSTSVRWDGGVIGIVRAELELARALHELNPSTRFVAFNGEAFVEMEHERIRWLFVSRSVADAYLKVRDYFRAAANYKVTKPPEFPRYRQMMQSLPPAPANDPGSLLRLSLVFGATTFQSPPTELLLKGMLKLYEPIRRAREKRKEAKPQTEEVAHHEWELDPGQAPAPAPFGPNAIVFSAGWMDTGREKHLAAIKQRTPGLQIAQLIYDVIPIHQELQHLYPEAGSKRFERYFSWVARHADVVFCGGENTRSDVLAQQQRLKLPSPRSLAVRFGDARLAQELQYDPVRDYYPDDATLLRMLRITRPYVLCVGTIEARKNHAVLYEAMRVLYDRHGVDCPLMVFAGISDARTRDLMDSIARDPKTRDHILHLVPTDHQLQVVYRNAAFTLLPTLYEGWSLTLPESLSFGKFVIASDIAPLKEIGTDRIDYLPPHEPRLWADRIEYYLKHPDALAAREKRIVETWAPQTWTDTARTIAGAVLAGSAS